MQDSKGFFKILVMYPGRFQPPHKGHLKTYRSLVRKYGEDSVYICTSDNITEENNYISFNSKKYLLLAMGVKEDKIICMKSPYNITEFSDKLGFDKENTVVIVCVGSKDKERFGKRFKWLKTKKLKPVIDGRYLTTRKSVMSATDIRKVIFDPQVEFEDKVKFWQQATGLGEEELKYFIENIKKVVI